MSLPTTYHFRSEALIREVTEAMNELKPGWQNKVFELCEYHIEMRNHALKCERIIHEYAKEAENE